MVSINAKLLGQKKAFNYLDVMCKCSEQCYANSFFWEGGGGDEGEVNKGQGYNKLEYDLPAWDIVVTSKSETNKCILVIVTQI